MAYESLDAFVRALRRAGELQPVRDRAPARAGLTAYLAGLARTWTSSYDVAFITSGMLCMIAALMVLFVGRSARMAKPLPA